VSRPGALAALLALAAAGPAGAAGPVRTVDLVVRGGTVITMDREHRIVPDGAVAVDKGRVLAVGAAADIAASFRGRDTLDARPGIVIPGLVNAHTHAPMVLFRGVADDLKLMEWLQRYIFPAEKKNVTAPFVRAGMRLAALEMIRSGTTTFVDMYYFEDDIAEVAKAAGLRIVAGETLIEFPAPDNKTIAEALAYIEKFLQKWKGDPLVTPALAPHSAFLCSTETLKAARALADKYGAPLLIHVSETQDEQDQVKKRYGKTPTEVLGEIGFLRKGVLAAHGVWLSASDRALLKAAGAGVAHCPQSNMKLASGAAPVREMIAEDLRLGLGTDGAASNNDLDML
jgi:5-methylthioadenosine/S-adenosylhomocysteine deaminase